MDYRFSLETYSKRMLLLWTAWPFSNTLLSRLRLSFKFFNSTYTQVLACYLLQVLLWGQITGQPVNPLQLQKIMKHFPFLTSVYWSWPKQASFADLLLVLCLPSLLDWSGVCVCVYVCIWEYTVGFCCFPVNYPLNILSVQGLDTKDCARPNSNSHFPWGLEIIALCPE